MQEERCKACSLLPWAEGIVSGLFTRIREEKIRYDFNIPNELVIAVTAGFGYPLRISIGKSKNRVSLNDIVYHQRFEKRYVSE